MAWGKRVRQRILRLAGVVALVLLVTGSILPPTPQPEAPMHIHLPPVEDTPPTFAEQQAAVVIDFGAPQPQAQSLVGLLYGASAQAPSGQLIAPLEPRIWRVGTVSAPTLERMSASSSYLVLVVSDLWGHPGDKTWQPPYANYAKWENFVRRVAEQYRSPNIVFDIWNEPDRPDFWVGTQNQYLETFRRAHDALRSVLGTRAIIAGPSLSSYDPTYLKRFVDYALAHDLRVDVLTWHEFRPDSQLATMAQDLRAARARWLENPAYTAVGIRSIQIPETIPPQAQYRPGSALAYLHFLEQGGADAAGRACWKDAAGQSNCWNNTLDGLVDADTNQPRAVWWAYAAYARSLSGRVLAASQDIRLIAFASQHGEPSGEPQVVLAYYGADPAHSPPLYVNVLLGHIDHLGWRSAVVHVEVAQIPNSGTTPLPQLPVLVRQTVPVRNGTATITIPSLALYEGAVITLRPA